MTIEIGIYDHSQGKQIVRDMTADEIAQIEKEKLEVQAQKAEAQALAEAKAQARAALLERLGITEEEAKLLLG